jgi:hypothetical protein
MAIKGINKGSSIRSGLVLLVLFDMRNKVLKISLRKRFVLGTKSDTTIAKRYNYRKAIQLSQSETTIAKRDNYRKARQLSQSETTIAKRYNERKAIQRAKREDPFLYTKRVVLFSFYAFVLIDKSDNHVVILLFIDKR